MEKVAMTMAHIAIRKLCKQLNGGDSKRLVKKYKETSITYKVTCFKDYSVDTSWAKFNYGVENANDNVKWSISRIWQKKRIKNNQII